MARYFSLLTSNPLLLGAELIKMKFPEKLFFLAQPAQNSKSDNPVNFFGQNQSTSHPFGGFGYILPFLTVLGLTLTQNTSISGHTRSETVPQVTLALGNGYIWSYLMYLIIFTTICTCPPYTLHSLHTVAPTKRSPETQKMVSQDLIWVPNGNCV